MKGKKMTIEEKEAKLEFDKNERRKLFKNYCDHVSEGLSADCFSEISPESIRSYFERFPEEFSKKEFNQALQRGKEWWERTGHRQASGNCLGNSRTWYYNMVNRYGWHEKQEVKASHEGSLSVNVISYASQKASQDSVK